MHVPPGRSMSPPIVGAASESPRPRQAERHPKSQRPSQPVRQVQHTSGPGCGGEGTSLCLRPSLPACAPGAVFVHGGLPTRHRVPCGCRPDDSFLAGTGKCGTRLLPWGLVVVLVGECRPTEAHRGATRGTRFCPLSTLPPRGSHIPRTNALVPRRHSHSGAGTNHVMSEHKNTRKPGRQACPVRVLPARRKRTHGR